MTTLLQLRDRAKQESDMVSSAFVSDPEWDAYLNASYQEIYGLTAQVYGADYYVQTPSTGYVFTTDGINQFFSLPADFFKLLGVDVLYGAQNQWTALRPFAFADRNQFSAINTPIPAAGQQVRLLYIPTVTPLVLDADVLVSPITMNGWEEYVIADACIKALGKEESDVSVFAGRKAALTERINAESDNRDTAFPFSIVDSRRIGGAGMKYRLNGNKLWLIGWQVRGWPFGDWDVSDGRNEAWWW